MTITQILDQIRRLTTKLAKSGATTKEINIAIAELLKANGLQREMAIATQAEAEKEWISKHTLDDTDRKIITGIIDRASHDFAKVDGNIREGVLRVVAESRKSKLPLKELESNLLAELDKNKNWANSVARTTKSGFSRASTVRTATKAGMKYFRYEGAGAQRDFCIAHLGNTYSLSEIQSMDNGQGLPVLYYMGGYRCVHRWVAVEK